MSTISFQCYSCNQVLKVGADKAGKRGKCPKCGTALTIPVSSTDGTGAPPAMPGPHATPMPQQYPQQHYQAPQQPYPQPPPQPQPQYQQPYPPQQYPQQGYQQGYQQPAPGPMRAEYVEDEPPYAQDEYEDARPRRGGSKWAMPRIGLLIQFIANCVIAGAFVLQVICYLLMTIAIIRLMAGSMVDMHGPFGMFGIGQAAGVLLKIAEILTLGASVASIVAYVFWILGPKERGMMPMAITAVALGGVGLILAFIFRFLLFFSSSPVAGGGHPFFPWFMLLVVMLLYGGELIATALYLGGMAKSHPKGRRLPGIGGVLILASVYTGLRLILWIFLYVVAIGGSRGGMGPDTGKAMVWIMLLLLWAGTVVFTIFIINYLMRLWAYRSVAR
jgi:hypothetical protein